MSSSKKILLIVLGIATALLIISQLVMALLILQGADATIRKAHQHSGYLLVAVSLVYTIGSLMAIAAIPSKPKS